jgi:hypothetical protein
MGKHKKKLFWALILLLLFVPPCYYLKSEFTARKTQRERERLLVRRQISKPLEVPEGEGEEIERDLREKPLEGADIAMLEDTIGKGVSETAVGEIPIPRTPAEEAQDARRKELEARIRQLEQEILVKDKKIEGWEHRWKEKIKELERCKRELVVCEKEGARKEQKPLVQGPPAPREEKPKHEVREKRVVPPSMAATLEECQGVPISHRNLALILWKGLHLGSNLSYDQAVMTLHGLGILPKAGWNQGDPQFPIGADELEEILSRVERAISIGLVAAGYPELMGELRYYCKREKAQMVEAPQCEGPMVTECDKCEISQGDFAIYLCKVLGIGEDLNYEQSFLALTALHISPERGWRFEEPFVLITLREIEEIRCSVREAYEKGIIETEPTHTVASINDYCLWLKMNVEVVGEGTVAETVGLTDYQGGRIPDIPGGGTVASSSQ